MLWLWARGADKLELETRYDNDTGDFVVTRRWSDGRQRTERFRGLADFRTRLVELERELETERWSNTGPPVLLPDGWPNRRPI